MKVYKKLVIGIQGNVIEEDSYEYSGPVSECKGGGSSTTTTAVPSWQQPYLENIYGLAQGQAQKPVEYYPGQTVSPFAPEQTAAQQATTNRAMQGSPLLGAAQQVNLKTMEGAGFGQEYVNPLSQAQQNATISGTYLNPDTNPWLAKTYETAAKDVAKTFGQNIVPGITKEAGAAGAWGGAREGVARGAALTGFSENLADLATKIYAPAYETERGRQVAATESAQQLTSQQYQAERNRQMAAVGAAPALAEADYLDISKLAAVGQEKQAMDQANIDAAIKAFEFSQMEPWQRMGLYSNLITGDVGGTTISGGGGGK